MDMKTKLFLLHDAMNGYEIWFSITLSKVLVIPLCDYHLQKPMMQEQLFHLRQFLLQ
jgi:hypothetical protein